MNALLSDLNHLEKLVETTKMLSEELVNIVDHIHNAMTSHDPVEKLDALFRAEGIMIEAINQQSAITDYLEAK